MQSRTHVWHVVARACHSYHRHTQTITFVFIGAYKSSLSLGRFSHGSCKKIISNSLLHERSASEWPQRLRSSRATESPVESQHLVVLIIAILLKCLVNLFQRDEVADSILSKMLRMTVSHSLIENRILSIHELQSCSQQSFYDFRCFE